MKILLLALLLVPGLAFSLEVDEKLTARIIKTSDSRKTVLINRGTEDGLVEGDHARFMVTAGIVARGVIVKISPTRSVWSVYRLVNADYIVNDSVMTLKITPPVKLTKDDTQSILREDVPVRTTPDSPPVGVPLADGANDLAAVGSDEEDMKALTGESAPKSLVERNMEVVGLLNISSLSSTTSAEGGAEVSGSMAQYHIGASFEYYPQNERMWYSRFSLMGNLNLIKGDAQSYNGGNAKNDYTEFGVGVNWHPTKLPSQTGEFIPFITLGMGYGQAKSSLETAAGSTNSATGTGNSFFLGAGYKFYARNGFGARIFADYYMRKESYDADETSAQFSRDLSGPRVQVGLSYRF